MGDKPGDGAFDGWSPSPVGGLPVRVGGGLGVGVGLEGVVWPEGDDPAGSAFFAQEAAGALVCEQRLAPQVPAGRL